MDREKVIKGLEICRHSVISQENCKECPYIYDGRAKQSNCEGVLHWDAIALLKEQENLLKEYEKLSQVCFKIEKYLRIVDLSILIDRIEEGKVEVLQDDGRPDSMETTIKIRRM